MASRIYCDREVDRESLHPPPNRTVFDGESPPPYRSHRTQSAGAWLGGAHGTGLHGMLGSSGTTQGSMGSGGALHKQNIPHYHIDTKQGLTPGTGSLGSKIPNQVITSSGSPALSRSTGYPTHLGGYNNNNTTNPNLNCSQISSHATVSQHPAHQYHSPHVYAASASVHPPHPGARGSSAAPQYSAQQPPTQQQRGGGTSSGGGHSRHSSASSNSSRHSHSSGPPSSPPAYSDVIANSNCDVFNNTRHFGGSGGV